MSDFREAMWGVVQSAVSQLDFDFAGYAAEHFERLSRTRPRPPFRARWARRRRGAPAGAPRKHERDEPRYGGDSVGNSNSPSRSSSSRSSSSSVPIRTGPLNQFFAEMTHQPPKNESDAREPEDRVVRQRPGEIVVPGQSRLVERKAEQDRDERDPRRATMTSIHL